MYSKQQLKALDKIAMQTYKCKFRELDYEDQDVIYVYAEENGLL